ncbi:MAG: hypothetical protein ACYS8Z_13405 [Planctomycetota bacterium]|jgi:sRNA-binding regulator protein Hfq
MADDKTPELVVLATKKFGRLTAAESKLFRAVAGGITAEYSSKMPEKNDPAKAEEWGKSRVIKADRIVWLCTDKEASERVTHRGIDVGGARIDGELALSYCTIPFPLVFHKCFFNGKILLDDAQVKVLDMGGTRTGPITADGIKVDGGVFLRDGFKAHGEVRLLGAEIGGNLECWKGQFSNEGGYALNCDGMKVTGSVFLRDCFKAHGEVRLLGAEIGGQLSCPDGEFTNENESDNDMKYALNADAMKVSGPVFLNNDFKARGEVCLLGAEIGGSLDCMKGQFTNEGGYALNADRLKVSGPVFLNNGFKAQGEVCLLGTEIGGSLDCRGAWFTSKVSFDHARVENGFYWADVTTADGVTLDLRYAHVGTLRDDQDSWPEKGKLCLHGFVYDQLDSAEDVPRDVAGRIDWIQRQYDEGKEPAGQFWPQPYEQLAKVLRDGGDDANATKVLIQKEKDKRRFGKLTRLGRFWLRLLDYAVASGYAPWRPAAAGLIVFIAGCLIFWAAVRTEVMIPTRESAYVKDDSERGRHVSAEYQAFSAFLYSLDVFIPVVDLHQRSYWQPNANRVTGRCVRWWLVFETLFGWVVVTLLVFSLTRKMRV